MTSTRRRKMTASEFADRMRAVDHSSDPELRHQDADGLMIELLRSLGYDEGCAIFEIMHKWYV